MPNLTSVSIVDGNPTSGTGTVSTIDALIAVVAKESGGNLDAILTKLSADPASQTTLAAVLAKLIAAPATEAKQDTLIAKDFATQTTLAALLAKVISAPATEAKQDAAATLTGAITETAPGSDTASSGLNGRLQRIAQRLTTMLTGLSLAAGSASIGATKDDGPNWASVWGVSDAPVASADMSSATNVSDAPTSGQKIVIDDVILTNRTTGALECTLTCETTGAVVMGPLQVPANSSIQITLRGKRKLATADKKVKATWSAAGNVNVLIGFHSEA